MSSFRDWKAGSSAASRSKPSSAPGGRLPRAGDIFAYKVAKREIFGFGRLVAKVSVGMVAELFDSFSPQPIPDPATLTTWLTDPIILNEVILFENRMQGDWRIVGHDAAFTPSPVFKNVVFVYGEPGHFKGVDIRDSERQVTDAVAAGKRRYSALNDTQVQALVAGLLKDRK